MTRAQLDPSAHAPWARLKSASRDGEAFGLIERYLEFAGGPGLVTGMSSFFVQATQASAAGPLRLKQRPKSGSGYCLGAESGRRHGSEKWQP
jgi:hypothetical protein